MADFVISTSFEVDRFLGTKSVVVGTSAVDVFLRFDVTAGSGPNGFDSFTYAIEALSSAPARVPTFRKPPTLGDTISTWSIVDQSELGEQNQLAGNVNAAPAGQGIASPFGVTVLKASLDVSALQEGDTISLDPNLFGLTVFSLAGDEFGGNASYTFQTASMSIAAIPEPSSLTGLVTTGLLWVSLRLRKRRRLAGASDLDPLRL